MTRQTRASFTIATVLALSGACLAQPAGGGGQQPGGGGRQPGQPGQQGQPGGGGGGGGGNLVERLLQSDANGDGQLQWDEVPEQMRERVFERNDTNNDKVLDKAELEAMRQNSGRQGRGAGAGGAAGGAMSLHDGMEQANRAMRTLKRSKFESATREQDLRAVQSLQSGLIGAKSDVANAPMSDAAKAKYKNDTAAYQRDFRKMIIDAAMESLKLELAINAGDAAAATKSRDALEALEEAGHTQFQPADDERPAGGAGGRGPGGAGRGAGGGGGGQGGQPGGGGGQPPQ